MLSLDKVLFYSIYIIHHFTQCLQSVIFLRRADELGMIRFYINLFFNICEYLLYTKFKCIKLNAFNEYLIYIENKKSPNCERQKQRFIISFMFKNIIFPLHLDYEDQLKSTIIEFTCIDILITFKHASFCCSARFLVGNYDSYTVYLLLHFIK